MTRLSSMLVAMALALPLPALAEPAALAPYQMVRSLQHLQEAIAAGDHASLPMQRALLEMTDAAMRTMDDAALAEPANRRALLIYAMSGGNPTTLAMTLARLTPDDPDRRLGEALLPYLHGRTSAARASLAAFDPALLPAELGAYLSLVRGSLLATEQPAEALAFLDRARLLSPGTLVEEAALRRSVGLAVTLRQEQRFTTAAHRYATAFIQSPYASQFADSFVDGVVAFHPSLDLDEVAAVAAMMNAEQEKVIWLRIARLAAIEGLRDLAAFASDRAGPGDEDDRATLYASLSAVASQPSQDMLARLRTIDRDELSADDRRLLDAVHAVVGEMAAPVDGMPAAPALPPPPAATAPQAPAAPVDPTDAMLANGHATLAEIDALLEATPE